MVRRFEALEIHNRYSNRSGYVTTLLILMLMPLTQAEAAIPGAQCGPSHLSFSKEKQDLLGALHYGDLKLPNMSLPGAKVGQVTNTIGGLNSHLPQPAQETFDLAFLRPIEKTPVAHACVDMVLQGRDTGTAQHRGGPTYFTCNGNKLINLKSAPCQTDEDRKQVRKVLHLIADCMNLDPQMVFPLWAEESGLQFNIRNRDNDMGISQMNRISLKDSALTLASPKSRALLFERLNAKTQDPVCAELFKKAGTISQKVLRSMSQEEQATLSNPSRFRDEYLCAQTSDLVAGPDAVFQNVLFSATGFAKSVYYLNANMKRIFKAKPSLTKVPFASNEDARKVFGTLARESGFGHVHATRLASRVLSHYQVQFQSAEFARKNPKGITFEMFQRDFLEKADSKFAIHRLITQATRTRTNNSTYGEPEKQACFAEFKMPAAPRNMTPVQIARGARHSGTGAVQN